MFYNMAELTIGSGLFRNILGVLIVFLFGMFFGIFLFKPTQTENKISVNQKKLENYSVPVTVIDNSDGDQVKSLRKVLTKKKSHVGKNVSPHPRSKIPTPNKVPHSKTKKLDLNAKKTKLAWRIHSARLADNTGNKPAIAIVLDDLGVNQLLTEQAIGLPPPLTLALIPYGKNLRQHAAAARRRGHELLVHLPMEPIDAGTNPGKNALLTNLSTVELRNRVSWNLSQFNGFVGVNNHMGSKFTAWYPGMTIVMRALKRRGLLFLDSKTTSKTRGESLAMKLGVPHAVRDVFLDNKVEKKAIQKQLAQLELVAKKNGTAIGIGHPYNTTIAELRTWIPAAKNRGFAFISVAASVRRQLSKITRKKF
tara:strand:+ start:310 stop:1404 length:1095 start_codon:yes stop_codon:yes gene_type:complete